MQLRFEKNRFKTVSVICVVVFSTTVFTGIFLYKVGFRFNLTPSLPIGIWKIDKAFTQIERDDYVWFTPTKEMASFAIERGYLKESKNCPNNTIPMLKQVYGLPGDEFSFFKDVISINNTTIKNAKRRQYDSKERPMPQIEGGIVQDSHLFVLTLNSHSFDSRYFGPIPIKNIIGTAKPVILWKN